VDIPADVVEPNDAMREAIWQAQMWHLDELLDVTVTIDPGLEDFLDELKPGDPPEATISASMGASE
jgi:hypothetical protein